MSVFLFIILGYNYSLTIDRYVLSVMRQWLTGLKKNLLMMNRLAIYLDIRRKLTKKDNWLKGHRKTNDGQGIARNYGMAQTTRGYVTFVGPGEICSAGMYSVIFDSINDSVNRLDKNVLTGENEYSIIKKQLGKYASKRCKQQYYLKKLVTVYRFLLNHF